MTRREFLVTAWAAAVTAVTAVAGGLGLWHATPAEEAASPEIVELDAPPPPDAPVEIPAGKFAWVNNGEGVAAISQVCPHMGCVLAWQAQEGQFQCPCHGSKFDREGSVVHGPAEHPLTYLEVTALDAEGRVVDRTTPEHRWVQIGKNIRYRVHVGKPVPEPEVSGT